MRKLLALAGALTLGYAVSACGGSWFAGAIFGALLGSVSPTFSKSKASASKRVGIKKQAQTEPVTRPAQTKSQQPQIFFYGIERRLILEDDSSALLFDELIKRIRRTNPSSRAGVFLMQCRDDRARRS